MIALLRYGSLLGNDVRVGRFDAEAFERTRFTMFAPLHDLRMVELIALEGEEIPEDVVNVVRDVVLPSGATVTLFGVTRL